MAAYYKSLPVWLSREDKEIYRYHIAEMSSSAGNIRNAWIADFDGRCSYTMPLLRDIFSFRSIIIAYMVMFFLKFKFRNRKIFYMVIKKRKWWNL